MLTISLVALFLQAAPRDLAPILAPLHESSGLPALGAAIVTREDGLVALGVVGRRAATSESEVRAEDPWHIGSCTKALTATLAARLVEQGLVGWSTTLGDVFAPGLEEMDPSWKGVTLEELLAHRSGAAANPDGGGLWLFLTRHSGTPPEQRRTLLEAVLARPPEHERGAFLYSNTGYALAGALLEARAQRPYEELLRREVFEPLGMHGAGFGAPGQRAPDEPEAVPDPDAPRGHRRAAEAWQPVHPGLDADNPPAIAPAGTVHAPLAAWAAFVRAHLAGAAGDESYLPRASWQKLHTPIDGDAYALGWLAAERPWAGGTALTHAGSNTMWYCVAWLAPERGFAVLVTTNAAGDGATRVCDGVAAALIGEHLAALDGGR